MKTPDFNDRLSAASSARKAQLERARALAEDPQRLDRLRARTETIAARKARIAEREAVRRPAKEREAAELAAAQAARSAARRAPNVARWREAVRNRPTAQKGVDLGKEWCLRATSSDKERKILFNPTAQAVLGRG